MERRLFIQLAVALEKESGKGREEEEEEEPIITAAAAARGVS
jgi:hypothetical protein